MARKSTKTARVMNLLANGDSTDPEVAREEAADVNRAATQTAETPQTIKELTELAQKASAQAQEGAISPITIIDMSATAPDPVAELIKEKLEDEEKEQTEALTVPQTSQDGDGKTALVSDQTTGPVLEGGRAMGAENELEEELDLNPEAESELHNDEDQAPGVGVPAPAILPPEEVETALEELEEIRGNNIPVETEDTHAAEDSYQYLNVMEMLVKEKVLQYMNMFDVCTCDRCTADTTALTLTHLPPKYMVVPPASAAPLLNFYSNKFSQQVVVELTKACSIVKQNPHH